MGNIQKANPTSKGSQMSASAHFFWKKKIVSLEKNKSSQLPTARGKNGVKMPGARAPRASSVSSLFQSSWLIQFLLFLPHLGVSWGCRHKCMHSFHCLLETENSCIPILSNIYVTSNRGVKQWGTWSWVSNSMNHSPCPLEASS